jgi:molybdopterin/thiamine biosynthesis adenylyltransferase
MRILVCGVGTLGGNLVEHLARRQQPGQELSILDHDLVEQRNLKNQPYFQHQLGKPKVNALAETIFRISGMRVQTQARKLTEGNAERFVEGYDLVFDCFDNHEARLALQRACRSRKVELLHLGLAPDYGEVIWDEFYRVPPQGQRDPCAEPLSRGLALMTVCLCDNVLHSYLERGVRENLSFTAQDLAVNSPVLA